MIRWTRQYVAISRNALTVTMSDPVYLILLLCVIALMAFFGTLPTFNFGQELRLVRDQSLALIFLGGCVMAALAIAGVVVRDLRLGAISVLMSRPVSGITLVLGKWTGVALAVVLYQLPATIACLWITRITGGGEHGQELNIGGLLLYFGSVAAALALVGLKHYFFGGWYVWEASLAILVVFGAAFLLGGFGSETWGADVDWRAVNGSFALLLAELIFAAVLMPFAVKLDTALVLGVGVVVFFLGMVSNYVVNSLLAPGVFYYLSKAIVPNWQVFWISDWLATRGDLDWRGLWGYIGRCSVHTAAYVSAALALAALLFNRREFYGDDTL